jgi:hypothetical protein
MNQQLDTLQNGWSARVDKRFWNDTLDCKLLGVHYVERNDVFLRPRVTYELTDGWRATAGGEIFRGPRCPFFGRIGKKHGGLRRADVQLLIRERIRVDPHRLISRGLPPLPRP